uniref:Cytochrome b5 heme-binding domain-containing protein n=1 Tax=Bionectria ochroleuca TaxID=29856 RepID=A0A0B7KEF1_BIOOC
MSTVVVTTSELAQHCTANDLWVSVHGKGGIDSILQCAGDDGTEAYDYAGHSKSASATLKRFFIGALEGHDEKLSEEDNRSEPLPKPEIESPPNSYLPSSYPLIGFLRLFIGTALGGFFIAIGSRFALQNQSLHTLVALGKRTIDSVGAFGAGALLSSSVALVVFAYAYEQFRKTLRHTKEPFAYPPIIPRPFGISDRFSK